MAIRKKDDSGSGKRGTFIGKLKTIRNIIFFFLAFLLGGIVFNLDRAGDWGVFMLRCKNFIPYPLSKFLPGAGAAPGAAVPEQIIQGRVIEIYDGDTVTVLDDENNKKYRVRFFGMDAPEKAMKYGRDSQAALQQKLLGKTVAVQVVSVDLYQRSVGKVMLGSRYINMEMVSEGYAWYYPDYAADEYDLAAAEREARMSRRGLWQENNPTPPWEYRKRKKR